MTERIRAPRARLYDLEWDETSFVVEGDNPGAMILFTKDRDDESEAVAEAAIAAIAKDSGADEGGDMTLTTRIEKARTQAEVVAAVDAERDRIIKQDPMLSELAGRDLEGARAKATVRVYETHNIVLERGYQLGGATERASPDVTPEAEAFMAKGAPPSEGAEGAFMAEVRKAMDRDGLDEPRATAKVYDARPDLVRAIDDERRA